MHGAAVEFAQRIIPRAHEFDLILGSDLIDMAVFIALIRQAGMTVPVPTYFHENQLSYPFSPRDQDASNGRDRHYAFINYTTALASDEVYFNSQFHRRDFFESFGPFLESFPDHRCSLTLDSIRRKASVLPLGLDLKRLDEGRSGRIETNPVPVILWNHRMEFDKRPKAFFQVLQNLADQNLDFQVVILGERPSKTPAYLKKAREVLASRIIQDGPVQSAREYASWCWRSDLQPVTSAQEFFGGSVVEAAYCDVQPLLPDRLAYPEHFPGEDIYYQSDEELTERLAAMIESGSWRDRPSLRRYVEACDWSVAIRHYDEAFTKAASG